MRGRTKSQDQKRRANRNYARMRRAMESPRERELRRKLARDQAAARRAAETPEQAERRRADARKRRRDKAKAQKRLQKRVFREMNIQPGLCADMLECCLKVEPESYNPDCAAPLTTSRGAAEADMEIKNEPVDEQDKKEDACVSGLPKISNYHSLASEKNSASVRNNINTPTNGSGPASANSPTIANTLTSAIAPTITNASANTNAPTNMFMQEDGAGVRVSM